MRPAASVSSVIFFSTLPSAVPPWLFHVTWSPLLNFSSAMPAITRPRRTHTIAPTPPHSHRLSARPTVTRPLKAMRKE